nr:putative ribonuclease H-like domain-containing protein [Tanacetum cinerariifolium]
MPKAVLNAVQGNHVNAVKASACWVWRPKQKVLDHLSKNIGASMTFKRFNYIDAQGISKSYLINYEKIDGGFVTFGGNSKGGKITRKGKIRTGKLDFEDVYFVKELKLNLFSVSQMRHKKKSVLFTDSTCVVLSSDFKLTDESYVFLKVLRKDNMYSVDLMNVVHQGGRKHALSFMRPFRCPLTNLNAIDHLGKFNGKADEGFLVGYSTNSKAFRVFNSRTRIVEENLRVKFSKTKVETVPDKDYILLPLWTQDPPFSSSLKDSPGAGFKPLGEEEKKDDVDPRNEDSQIPSIEEPRVNQEKDANVNNTNNINTVSLTDNAAGIEDNAVDENIVYGCADDPNIPDVKEIGRFGDAEDDDSGADINNLDTYFQMDVKSAFVYGKIEKEVYVCQPPGFDNLDFNDKVYKVEKALYGLHQAPKAWYETLSTYLLDNGFQRRMINKTLFIKRDKSDILLVQVYVDDIVFGSTRKEMCTEFKKMMHKKFQMSSIGELTFFLGLQVKQKEYGIFISQDKYVNEILNKFGFSDVKTASTHMETHKTLLKDEKGEDVDEHLYRSMIGSSKYLTSSRPDIMFTICACARFQDSPFDLVTYTNSDYARASLDRKSTIRGCQFLGYRLISWQCKKQTVVANSIIEAGYVAALSCCGQVLWIQNQLLDYGDSNKKNLIQMNKINTDKNVVGCLEWNGKAAKDEIGISAHNLNVFAVKYN